MTARGAAPSAALTLQQQRALLQQQAQLAHAQQAAQAATTAATDQVCMQFLIQSHLYCCSVVMCSTWPLPFRLVISRRVCHWSLLPPPAHTFCIDSVPVCRRRLIVVGRGRRVGAARNGVVGVGYVVRRVSSEAIKYAC